MKYNKTYGISNVFRHGRNKIYFIILAVPPTSSVTLGQ